MIVDVDTPSAVPRIAEPFFLILHAEVGFRICMTAADLAVADLGKLGRQFG